MKKTFKNSGLALVVIGALVLLSSCQQLLPAQQNQINEKPSAQFEMQPSRGAAPLKVSFDARSSKDDGEVIAFDWDLGDGSVRTSQAFSHVYNNPGSYPVTLTVTDDQGETATVTQNVTVLEPTGENPPVASFTVSVSSGNAPLDVNFDASSSADDGSIKSYSWDFGDGAFATGVKVTHQFVTKGRYEVVLSIVDNDGLSATSSQTIVVEDGQLPEQANMTLLGEAFLTENRLLPSFKQRLAESASAAVIASLLVNNGQLITVGTLTQIGPAQNASDISQVFRYDSSPNDHLRVVLLDGKEYDIWYSLLEGVLEGSSALDGTAFVQNDHRASVQINSNEAAGNYAIKLESLRKNGDIGVIVQGMFKDDKGQSWAVDLSVKGNYFFNSSDASLEENLGYRGTLSLPLEELSLTIDRDYHYYSIDVLIDSSDDIRHRWSYKGQSYQAKNMHFRRLFKTGRINEPELWRAEGTIEGPGGKVGEVGYTYNQATLSIYLDLLGERLDLYSFMF